MEWLILVVVVPLLLVPLVLVFGFAGCGLDAVGSAVPIATKLTAKAAFVGTESKIILSWIGGGGAARYKLWRGEEGTQLEPIPTVSDITAPMFTDSPATGLSKEGTTYVYRVQAGTLGGPFGSLSNEAKATTRPAAPVLMNALPLTTAQIKLIWLRKSEKGTKIRIERRKLPATGDFVYRNETTYPDFTDGVEPGSTYEYQVFDIVKGYDESIEKEVLSLPSNPLSGQPLP